MEDTKENSQDVTFIKEEKTPPKQRCGISQKIFGSAAKSRTKKLVEKAISLQRRNRQAARALERREDFNDTCDFREVPKLWSGKSRLKLKSSSSSNQMKTMSADVIVLDDDSTQSAVSKTVDSRPKLCSLREDTNVLNNAVSVGDEATATPTLLSENDAGEAPSCLASSDRSKENSEHTCQKCLVCGLDFDALSFKKHRLECLRTNFSKMTDGRQTSESDDVSEGMSCPICKKSLTHMNSQRQTQHINKCMDKESENKEEEALYQQQLQAARTTVLGCPLCKKKLKTQSSRQSHLKKCALANKMTVEQLKTLMKQQEEEHHAKLDAGILPEDFIPSKLKALRSKSSKTSRPKNQLDEDTQLAMALSTSLADDRERHELEFVRYSCCGAGSELALPVGPESAMLPGKGQGKGKRGKQADPTTSLLMTLSKEKALERISHRVDRYIFSNMQTDSVPPTPPFTTGTKLQTAPSEFMSTSTNPAVQTDSLLWSKTSLNQTALESSSPAGLEELEFYVREIMPPVSVCQVAAGSKLKRVSTIPGRRRSEETEQLPSVDETPMNDQTASQSSSQTVAILAELAMEGEMSCTGQETEASHRPSQTELKSVSDTQDMMDVDSEMEASGFCKEDPIKLTEPDSPGVSSCYLGLVNSSQFSDVIILAEGNTELHAHKLILYARCPALLAISTVKNSKDVIDLSSHSEESVMALLRYMYAGQISLLPSCLSDIRQLANRFSLTRLADAAAAAAAAHVDSETCDVWDIEAEKHDGVNDVGETRIEGFEEKTNCDERNRDEREANFDEDDWLDVFLTQKENMRQRTASVSSQDGSVHSDGFEVGRKDEEEESCNDGERERHCEDEGDLQDVNQNNHLEVTDDCGEDVNVSRVDCELDIEQNKPVSKISCCSEGASAKTSSETAVAVIASQEMTLHSDTNKKQVFGQNFKLTDDLGAREEVEGMLFANEEVKKMEPDVGESHELQQLNEKMDAQTKCPQTTNRVDEVAVETSEVNISDESLSLLDTHVANPLISPQLIPEGVTAPKKRRKRKKVSAKEFRGLVSKVASVLPDLTNTGDQPSTSGILTDEDIERIAIKIEQDFQTFATNICDPSDSFYIPSVLDDNREDETDVVITHADIKTPVMKRKRRQGRKSQAMKSKRETAEDPYSLLVGASDDVSITPGLPASIYLHHNASTLKQTSSFVHDTSTSHATDSLNTNVKNSFLEPSVTLNGSAKAPVLTEVPSAVPTQVLACSISKSGEEAPSQQITTTTKNSLGRCKPSPHMAHKKPASPVCPPGTSSRVNSLRMSSINEPSAFSVTKDGSPSLVKTDTSFAVPSCVTQLDNKVKSSPAKPKPATILTSVGYSKDSPDSSLSHNALFTKQNLAEATSIVLNNDRTKKPLSPACEEVISGDELFSDSEEPSPFKPPASKIMRRPSDASWTLSTQLITSSPITPNVKFDAPCVDRFQKPVCTKTPKIISPSKVVEARHPASTSYSVTSSTPSVSSEGNIFKSFTRLKSTHISRVEPSPRSVNAYSASSYKTTQICAERNLDGNASLQSDEISQGERIKENFVNTISDLILDCLVNKPAGKRRNHQTWSLKNGKDVHMPCRSQTPNYDSNKASDVHERHCQTSADCSKDSPVVASEKSQLRKGDRNSDIMCKERSSSASMQLLSNREKAKSGTDLENVSIEVHTDCARQALSSAEPQHTSVHTKTKATIDAEGSSLICSPMKQSQLSKSRMEDQEQTGGGKYSKRKESRGNGQDSDMTTIPLEISKKRKSPPNYELILSTLMQKRETIRKSIEKVLVSPRRKLLSEARSLYVGNTSGSPYKSHRNLGMSPVILGEGSPAGRKSTSGQIFCSSSGSSDSGSNRGKTRRGLAKKNALLFVTQKTSGNSPESIDLICSPEKPISCRKSLEFQPSPIRSVVSNDRKTLVISKNKQLDENVPLIHLDSPECKSTLPSAIPCSRTSVSVNSPSVNSPQKNSRHLVNSEGRKEKLSTGSHLVKTPPSSMLNMQNSPSTKSLQQTGSPRASFSHQKISTSLSSREAPPSSSSTSPWNKTSPLPSPNSKHESPIQTSVSPEFSASVCSGPTVPQRDRNSCASSSSGVSQLDPVCSPVLKSLSREKTSKVGVMGKKTQSSGQSEEQTQSRTSGKETTAVNNSSSQVLRRQNNSHQRESINVSRHVSGEEIRLGEFDEKTQTASGSGQPKFTQRLSEKEESPARKQIIWLDADSPLPLRQRLGLPNPFHSNTEGRAGQVTKDTKTKQDTATEDGATKKFDGDFCEVDDDDDDVFFLKEVEAMERESQQQPELCTETRTSQLLSEVKTPQHQTVNMLKEKEQKKKKKAWKEPSPFTPMAPYDDMATPELKKAVSKIGVRPVGKKRMRELLKHVYHETHQYETDSDYDGTPVKYGRTQMPPSRLTMAAKLSHQPIGVPETSGVAKNQKPSKPAASKGAKAVSNPAGKAGSRKKKAQGKDIMVSRESVPVSGHSESSGLENEEKDDEEVPGSQDSSYSDGPDFPEESILQGWPEEEEVALSQLTQSSAASVTEKLVQFVMDNKDVYESILMYEPLELDVLKKRIADAGIRIAMPKVLDFLDERCITFTMKNMGTRNTWRQARQRPKKSGRSPRKRQNQPGVSSQPAP